MKKKISAKRMKILKKENEIKSLLNMKDYFESMKKTCEEMLIIINKKLAKIK